LPDSVRPSVVTPSRPAWVQTQPLVELAHYRSPFNTAQRHRQMNIYTGYWCYYNSWANLANNKAIMRRKG